MKKCRSTSGTAEQSNKDYRMVKYSTNEKKNKPAYGHPAKRKRMNRGYYFKNHYSLFIYSLFKGHGLSKTPPAVIVFCVRQSIAHMIDFPAIFRMN